MCVGSGRDPLGVQRFCKECTERCNKPISYENGLLSFGLTSTEKVHVGALGKKIIHKSFLGGGGGGKLECLGGKLHPPPPLRPPTG